MQTEKKCGPNAMPVLSARVRVAIRKCLDSPVARDIPEHGDKSLRSGERALNQNSCVVQAVAKCNAVQHKLSIVRGNRVSSHGTEACAPLDVATSADFKGLCVNHDPSAEGKSSERFAAIICSSSAENCINSFGALRALRESSGPVRCLLDQGHRFVETVDCFHIAFENTHRRQKGLHGCSHLG
jgi:hypothetical protein